MVEVTFSSAERRRCPISKSTKRQVRLPAGASFAVTVTTVDPFARAHLSAVR